eukprot:CAMPEP_0197852656 /NCGR_PEP_ID=MMETSP1438-20131217/21161_1 /TAXON_ID=1461541 /ORGANISM="Pterosperma sp., Strain CCMP1384" /LENGTH=424 /DNA_ID=CAMNT_0043466813 /DNA_START=125 /DNA_END=1399 /DNA_ORIENTATION=+
MCKQGVLLGAVTVLLQAANAWDCEGHMVVAAIARKELESQGNTYEPILTKLSTITGYLGDVSGDDSFDVVHSACWADTLSHHNFTALDSWHYLNTVYNPESTYVPQSCALPENQETDAEGYPLNSAPWALSQMVKSALRPRDPETIEDAMFEMSFAMRLLVHIVGDIHQPLHCIDRFSHLFPNGDKGGNLVHVNSSIGEMNLHEFWDRGAGLLGDGTQSNLAISNDAVAALVDNITGEYPRDHVTGIALDNYTKWAEESYDMAVHVSYYDITSNTATLSAKYEEAAKVIVKKRLAIAGYRLADMMKQYEGNPSKGGSGGLQGMLNRYQTYIAAGGGTLLGVLLGMCISSGCCCKRKQKKETQGYYYMEGDGACPMEAPPQQYALPAVCPIRGVPLAHPHQQLQQGLQQPLIVAQDPRFHRDGHQ